MTIGAMVGPEAFTEVRYLAHAKQIQALDLIPSAGRGVPRSASGARRAAAGRLPLRGRQTRRARARLGLGTIAEVIDELREPRATVVGALALKTFRPFPFRSSARRSRHARARGSCSSGPARSAFGGIVSGDVRSALAGAGWRPTPSSPGSAGAPSPAVRCGRCSTTPRTGGSSALRFLDLLHRHRGARADPQRARRGTAGPPRREHPCASSASSPRGRYERDATYQIGYVRGRWPAARPEGAVRAGRPQPGQRDHQGPPCLPGLRRGARRALCARRRSCAPRAGRLIAANATGCLEVFSTPYPETSWRSALDPLAVRQRPGGGDAASRPRLRPRDRRDDPRRRPGRRRRDGRHRLRPACRGCSSAAMTCSTSVTTTRAT